MPDVASDTKSMSKGMIGGGGGDDDDVDDDDGIERKRGARDVKEESAHLRRRGSRCGRAARPKKLFSGPQGLHKVQTKGEGRISHTSSCVPARASPR